jgi:DNA-binding NtrC family response regulator
MANSDVRKVFLVDDDPMHLQMLKDHLSSKFNIDITTFSTGEDCLANLDKDPDVIVLDYYLNSVEKSAANGIEILKKIKARKPETEVVMMSGQEKIEIAVETMACGAFDYVIKNESSFLRAENKLVNVFKHKKLQDNVKLYKKGMIAMAVVVVIVIITAVVLVSTGIATENPGW